MTSILTKIEQNFNYFEFSENDAFFPENLSGCHKIRGRAETEMFLPGQVVICEDPEELEISEEGVISEEEGATREEKDAINEEDCISEGQNSKE
ncbi:hypothetical protein AVEN_230701-1 [Araneus ventricosus]|uniref:Uncharacterized protein n=1 Tax=Araneus ventricosus TaxID=182803 RepID=A0A4Y2A1U6_ARAVE|nr:hypothetical protein AVEN_230701-1 [Araneus ventricosus]